MRLLPRSLAGRLVAFLLIALAISQVVVVVIFLGERRHVIRTLNENQFFLRTASLVQLLNESPPELHNRLIDAASLPRQSFWLGPESDIEEPSEDPRTRELAARLAERFPPPAPEIRLRAWHRDDGWRRHDHDDDDDHDGDHDDDDDDDHWDRRDYRGGDDRRWHEGRWQDGGFGAARPVWMELSVRLEDGSWLGGRAGPPRRAPRWAAGTLASFLVAALAITLVVVLVVRRTTRPMNRLAEAADRLGRGESPGPVPEEGPEEIRRATRAFNRMQERLERFVADRTRMLAAISHDLRTPITSLRLRAEFVEDEAVREKILETLDEMQRMAEETLAFAREEAAREDTVTVDLSALIGSLCDDLADLGQAVTWAEAPRCPMACRPVALKRALRNLIENAVAYGERAEVSMEADEGEARITIRDWGPGIPEEAMERVFEPFVRLEESRSRETGGVGLGLAIARSIIRAHGGDVALENLEEGGLQVTVTLPLI